MFETLADIWNQNQNNLQEQGVNPGQMNTAGIAGQLIASGVRPQDAYVQAAQIFRGQEQSNLERLKQERKQQQLAVASQILQQGGSLADLLAAGVDNPAILGALPQSQWIPDINNPEGGSFRTPGVRGMQGSLGGTMQGPQNNMMSQQQMPQQARQQNIAMNNRMIRSEFEGNTPAEKAANIEIQKRRSEETDKWQKILNDQANASSNVITNIGRVKKVIPKMFTGTGANIKYEVNKALGTDKPAVVATEKFNAAVSQVIDDLQTQKTRGVTDSGRDLIIATKPHLENTREGSESIANAIDAHAKGQQEKAKAANEWLRMGGDKNEFEIRWRDFEESHPFITDNEKTGLLETHEENIHKWKDVLFGEKDNAPREDNENPFLRELQRRNILP